MIDIEVITNEGLAAGPAINKNTIEDYHRNNNNNNNTPLEKPDDSPISSLGDDDYGKVYINLTS